MAKRLCVLILLLVRSRYAWIVSEWLTPHWFHLDDCWADPSCFELKRGQFGPQRRGPDGWQIRPRYPGNSLIADTRFGYPAFYVRDFLEGEEKFIRGYNLTVYEKFKRLPVRTHLSPYLLFFKPTFCGDDGIACPRLIEDLVKKRNDIIWVGHDLDGMRLGRPGYTLPGITIPGELGSTITYAWRYRGRPKHPHKHYLTFQGKCPSRQHAAQWHMNYSVRGELNRLFNEVNEDNFGSNPRKGLPNGVKYVCVDRQKGRVSSDKEVNRRYHDILDTDYALVPRGDERWSFRFLEAVGAGAIPVVVADGLSLPYDNLIDWEGIVVRIPEQALLEMNDYRDLLALLPGPVQLKVRYEAIRMVNARYFADGRTLEWAFEMAVTRYIEKNQRAKWRIPS